MLSKLKLTGVAWIFGLAACQPTSSSQQIQWQDYQVKPRIAGSVLEQRHAVYFATDKHDISADEGRSLQAFASGVEQGSTIRIRINGHADLRGTSPYNMQLSMRRAKAVARYLSDIGMTNVKLDVDGFGEEAPAAIGQNPESLALNRRVEIIAESVAIVLEGCSYTDVDHSLDKANQPHPRLGCANLSNLSAMIEDRTEILPTQVIGNKNIDRSDSASQFGAVDRYRKGEIPPLPDSGGS